MLKARLGALGLAALSVGLIASPAFAAKSVTRFTGKDAFAWVTNCDFDAVGSTCTVYGIFASKARINTDGTISRFASLELDGFRVKIVDVGGVVNVTFLAAGFADRVSLQIPDDLSSATGQGRVGSVTGSKVSVSFSLTATSPLFRSHTETVDTIGGCKVFVDRFTGKSRNAAGSAVIGGKTFVSSEFIPQSSIDTSHETTIFRTCA